MKRFLLTSMIWLSAAGLAGAEQPWRLSIDITERAGEPFERAVALIRQAGADVTSLSLFWDDLEDPVGGYAPGFDWPSLANAFYPGEGIAVSLTFSVIDTVADRRRSDLRAKPWDDPELIAAFARHLNDVLSRMQSVEITAVAIGNEVDGYLTSEAEIVAFAGFLGAARQEVHRLRPGVPVGVKLTQAAVLQNPVLWSPLLARSDALMITYYPLDGFSRVKPRDAIRADLEAIGDQAGKLPLYILEAGYPSAGCGGSPEGQKAFVQDLLSFADRNPEVVRLVSVTWLNDISLPEVEAYAAYYSVDLPCFAQYLGSLGLRGRDGTVKPALDWLMDRPKPR